MRCCGNFFSKRKEPNHTNDTDTHLLFYNGCSFFFLVAFFLLKKVCCKNSLTCCPQGTTCSDYKAPGWPSWGAVTTCVPSNSNGDAGEQGSGASDNSPQPLRFSSTRGTLMVVPSTPLRRGGRRTPSVSSRFVSKLHHLC